MINTTAKSDPDPYIEARNILFQVGQTTLMHPVDLTRTLVQMGYEPFPPVERRFFFGSKYLALPSTWQYLKYIKSVDGLLGIYRGLTPRICQTIVSNVVAKKVARLCPFKEEDEEESSSKKSFKLSSSSSELIENRAANEFLFMARKAGWQIISVSAGTIAAQPFFVIACRSMAQFVGREGKYCSIMESIQTIFNEEGVLGFFSGLTARVIADIMFVTVSSTLVHLMKSCFKKELKGESKSTVDTGVTTAANLIASSFAYQFHVVAAVMAVNDSGLALGRSPFTITYEGWYECWNHLARAKQLKRGSSIIGRYYTGPVITIEGSKRPVGFFFGPQHPPGLGVVRY